MSFVLLPGNTIFPSTHPPAHTVPSTTANALQQPGVVTVMPPKKKTANQVDQGAVAAQGNIFSEGADPMSLAIGVIDKKARNLEKRKVCPSMSPVMQICWKMC